MTKLSSLPKSDWSDKFLFPAQPQSNSYSGAVDWFDYTQRSAEDFSQVMDDNVAARLNRLYDKEYILDQYRNNWILFRRIPLDTVMKICRLAGLDYDEAVRVRDSRLRKWP